mmetsp:Transcript_8250/g.22017  ORF Transcript_8250/g.22017 Transcript_8250/m.22017 type:complete len:149 (+) Transcript_8250:367-813(+)
MQGQCQPWQPIPGSSAPQVQGRGTSSSTPMNRLTAKHKEDVLQTVVRLNGGKGDMSMKAVVSKELSELDLGNWNPSMAEAATFLKKRDYAADPVQLQIIGASKHDFLRNFWLSEANQQFPLLAVAANKLLSAHATTAAAERTYTCATA